MNGVALALRCGLAGRRSARSWRDAAAAARRGDVRAARSAARAALRSFSEVDPLAALVRSLGEGAPAGWRLAVAALREPSPRAWAEAWRKVVESDAGEAWAWAWRAKALEAAGEAAAASDCLDRAVALSPGSGWLRAWRGGLWLRSGDPRALAELDEAVRLDPGYPFGRAFRGGALRRAGRREEAGRELAAALAAEPCYEWTYGELAALAREEGRAEEAARWQAEAFLRDPKRAWEGRAPAGRGPHARAWRAWAALEARDVPAARRALGRAAGREPGFLLLQRARLAGLEGERALRLRLAAKAAAAAPLHAALAEAGRAALEAGEPRRAAEFLRLAVAANDAEVRARRDLAEALRRLGRAAEAARQEREASALEGGRPGPKTLDVFLNYACQAKCAFCYNPPLTPELGAWRLPLERLAAELAKGRREGYDGATYSGGEVTLLPDLPQRVALARRSGYRAVGIISNGIRLADPVYARLLARAGLTFAVLSVHGGSAGVHDRRVAVPGAFAKAVTALELLRSLGVTLVLNFVAAQGDAAEAPAFVERFAAEAGVAELQLYALHYDGQAALNASSLRLRYAEAVPHLRAALSAARRLGARERVFIYNVPPCVMPESVESLRNWAEEPEALLVDPEGLASGRIESDRRGRVKTEECARCVYGPRCLGFEKGYADAFGTGEMRAVAA